MHFASLNMFLSNPAHMIIGLHVLSLQQWPNLVPRAFCPPRPIFNEQVLGTRLSMAKAGAKVNNLGGLLSK